MRLTKRLDLLFKIAVGAAFVFVVQAAVTPQKVAAAACGGAGGTSSNPATLVVHVKDAAGNPLNGVTFNLMDTDNQSGYSQPHPQDIWTEDNSGNVSRSDWAVSASSGNTCAGAGTVVFAKGSQGGTGQVLACHQYPNGGPTGSNGQVSHFGIVSMSTPSGRTGSWTAVPSGFTVSNGANTDVDLVWTDSVQQCTTCDCQGTCPTGGSTDPSIQATSQCLPGAAIGGVAGDGDSPSQTVQVDLYIDGPYGSGTPMGSDTTRPPSNPYHGTFKFDLGESYVGRTFWVYVLGQDKNGNRDGQAYTTVVLQTCATDSSSPSFNLSANCSNISITGINDSDYSGGGMSFYVSINGSSQGSYYGSSGSDINIGTPSNYKDANSYTVTASSSGLNSTGNPGTMSASRSATIGPCDPNPASFSLGATCDKITVSGLTDPDNGGNVPLVITVDGRQLYNNSARGDVTVDFPADLQDASSHNVNATATSIMSDGSVNNARQTSQNAVVQNCFKANCTITSPLSSVVADARSSISATADIQNTGYFDWNKNNQRITTRLVYNGKTATPQIPATPAGGSVTGLQYQPFTVANDISNQTMTVEILLDANGPSGGKPMGSCSVSFYPYDYFTITPRVGDPTGLYKDPAAPKNNEDPNVYKLTSGADFAFDDPTVAGKVSTLSGGGIVLNPRIEKTPAGGSKTVTPGPSVNSFTNAPSYSTMSIPTNPDNLGDKYCAFVTLSFTKGKVNGQGTIYNPPNTPQELQGDCTTIATRPITRVYGGDVSAGFAACTGWSSAVAPSGGNIISWIKDATGAGAGTQLAAVARGQITDFSSGLGKSSPDGPPLFLTFASTQTPSPSAVAFGAGACPDDYWSGATGTTLPPGSIDLLGLPDGTYKGLSAPGPYTISSGTNFTGSKTFYIDGDVYINATQITYAGGSSLGQPWNIVGTTTTIPNFTLIAHGNIYIDSSVTDLDGIYIAQPVKQLDGTYKGGEIRTCVQDQTGKSSPDATVPGYYERCNRNLTVTGAFISKVIRLQRTNGNRKDSVNSDGPTNATNLPATKVHTGEIFIFSPEIWLRSPALTQGQNTKKYDSISSGAPIL